jgi:hypothetical protein
MQSQKQLWLERKSYLLPMLENIDDALDTIEKAGQYNSEALEAIVGLNELHHGELLTFLRACNNKPVVSNAKPIANIKSDLLLLDDGSLKSVRLFIPVDENDCPTLRISNAQIPHNEFPKD